MKDSVFADEPAGASSWESSCSIWAPAENNFCRVSMREVGGSQPMVTPNTEGISSA